MAMARITLADHFALQNFQGGKERGGAMAHVVMGEGAATALLERQTRLGPVQGLNLTFLIHTEHEGFIRRVQMSPERRRVAIDLQLRGDLKVLPALRRQQQDARAQGDLLRGEMSADLLLKLNAVG